MHLKNYLHKLNQFDAINFRSVHQSKATKTGGIAVFFNNIYFFHFTIILDQIRYMIFLF